MKKYKRPLILAGRGIRASGKIDLFREFVDKFKIPVVTSLLGIDVLPYNHPQRVGFIGIYGNRWANYALGNCDLLYVLGSRLDSRQTGNPLLFKGEKDIFHIDIEEGELNNNIKECTTIHENLADFLPRIIVEGLPSYETLEWVEEIENEKKKYPDIKELKNIKGINPNIFMHQLSQASQIAGAFTTDVGSNQMWCAQSLELNDDQLFLSSGGMGAMGYSLPAAIGASLSMRNKPIVSISGDGGFQINIQELETIRRNNLPIKMIIINNRCLGMIRQFQDAYFESRYQSTLWDYNSPSFQRIAAAYDIKSFIINTPEDVDTGLKRLWEFPLEPFLLEVSIDVHTDISPKVMFGNPLTKMN